MALDTRRVAPAGATATDKTLCRSGGGGGGENPAAPGAAVSG
ncbi:hypothetical protein EV655_10675 [Rhodovulum euryhalinum]|uniref:Uncharacterized protein n=1 Tax=Rhodovulum euryhalinum TaxID=35805 RepID=A0A4R2KDK5_9RHOB|nr:hypothetical protein EV655_10675 [Rhodovulum euryhalinum]